ncbi:unnamed protein product, partial [Didymodactylos carnosus]
STEATNTANGETVVLGINFSADIYNDDQGVSMENALWIDGKVFSIGKIIYDLPEEQFQTTKYWNIHSDDTSGSNDIDNINVQLTFEPLGSKEKHLNVIILVAHFVQPYGRFNGTIQINKNEVYTITNAFGVVENHYSKW